MNPIHSRRLLPSLLAGLALAAAGRTAAATPDWSLTVTPYVWVASVQLDSSLPNLPPSTPPDEKRFETKITGGLMLAGQLQHGDFGLFADYDWLRLNTSSRHPRPAFSAVDLRSNFYRTTVALTWRVPTGDPWQVDLLAGARFFTISGEQTFQPGILPGFTTSADKSWTDAAFGVGVRYRIDDTWFIDGKTMLGGFSSGSRTSVEGLLAVGYKLTEHWSAHLGYRYLHEDYQQSAFGWNMTAQGLLVGFAYRF